MDTTQGWGLANCFDEPSRRFWGSLQFENLCSHVNRRRPLISAAASGGAAGCGVGWEWGAGLRRGLFLKLNEMMAIKGHPLHIINSPLAERGR